MNRSELEQLARDALVARAEEAGVSRARILTRPELVDELLLRSAVDQATKQRARGLFGRARDLLARVVERGLHLPDAADRIRSLGTPIPNRPTAPAALPTVTLAEIYAAQGHRPRAIETLERVLAREPEHAPARTLLAQLVDVSYPTIAPRLPPEQDDSMVSAPDDSHPPATPVPGPVDGSDLAAGLPSAAFDAPGASRAEAVPVVEDAPPTEPMEMLDDAPLPTRYDVDECVAMTVDPTTLYVYWEIRRTTLDYLRASRPNATVALRFVVVVPTWDGPQPTVRDHDVLVALGDFFARDLPGGSIVRVAIGLRHEAGFDAIAHCGALEMPRGAPWPIVADTLLQCTPHGIGVPSRESNDLPALERAVERARRESALAERARRGPSPPLGGSERLQLR